MNTTPSYPPRPDNIPDNAIAKAALMIRELHEQTIDQIDKGHIYYSTQADGSHKDVSLQIRRECLAEIATCDAIMERSPYMSKDIEARGASLHFELQDLLAPTADSLMSQVAAPPAPTEDKHEAIPKLDATTVEALGVPGIGVYDHGR